MGLEKCFHLVNKHEEVLIIFVIIRSVAPAIRSSFRIAIIILQGHGFYGKSDQHGLDFFKLASTRQDVVTNYIAGEQLILTFPIVAADTIAASLCGIVVARVCVPDRESILRIWTRAEDWNFLQYAHMLEAIVVPAFWPLHHDH